MNHNPIMAALVVAGQPQFMAGFLLIVFLGAGYHLLRQPHTPERVVGPISAGIGSLTMIFTFIGVKLYIEACATGATGHLPLRVWGATGVGLIAAMVICAHCLKGGLFQSTAPIASGCGILLSGSASLATGCGALHLGAQAAGYKAAVALFQVSTLITAVFVVIFIASVLVLAYRRWRKTGRLTATKKAKA